MVGHGGSSAGSYLADPTSPIPSHCASIVVTSTVRVKNTIIICSSGITWELLHLLDYSDYWLSPQFDYIPLPLDARTERTRIRWWQMAPTSSSLDFEPSAWTLEDVYIGGTEINPSELYEDFEGNVWFNPFTSTDRSTGLIIV